MVQPPRVALPAASVVPAVPLTTEPGCSSSNVTDAPASRLPNLSVTVTAGRVLTAWPTTTCWSTAVLASTIVGGPAAALAVVLEWIGLLPVVAAVRVCAPILDPSVQVNWAVPSVPVFAEAGVTDPLPDDSTPTAMVTSATGPRELRASITTFRGSTVPT